MNALVQSIEYKNFRIGIFQDEDPQDPRKEFGGLGTMVCFHKRYDLGDKHSYNTADCHSWDDVEAVINQNNDIAVCLPIYMYDHSGITINTTGFSCPWDSGQIGFIFITKEQVRKEYKVKKISKKILEKVQNILESEVKIYDHFLTGAVYGYVITDANSHTLDSCWGFYGYEEIDYMVQQAKEICDNYTVTKVQTNKIKLIDSMTGKETEVTIAMDESGIYIRPKGYGDYCAAAGHGTPILIEYFDGHLRVGVWGDINHEDCTHLINMDGAKEKLRAKSA